MNYMVLEKVHDLMQGELAAGEAYREAIHVVAKDPCVAGLRHIHRDHVDSVQILSEILTEQSDVGRVIEPGSQGVPPGSREEATRQEEDVEVHSGVVGALAVGCLKVAKVFGEKPTISILKSGEKYGLSSYRELCLMPGLKAETRRKVLKKLIPRQQRHIRRLEKIEESM